MTNETASISDQVFKTTLTIESEREHKLIAERNEYFMRGFVRRVLAESYDKAFNWAMQQKLKRVPLVGPRFVFTLPDGSIFAEVQWGVTHRDIQDEIEEAWSKLF